MTNFELFKQEAVKNQPLTRQVRLSELEMLQNDKIGYNGLELSMTKDAISSLRSILGFGAQTEKNLDETFNEEVRRRIVNLLKVAKTSSSKDLEIQMIVSPVSKNVLNFLTKSLLITPSNFFSLYENFASDSNLEIFDTSIDASGRISISAKAKQGEFQVGSFADEVFHPGISFTSSYKGGIEVSSFVERLVCRNGMVRKTKEETIMLGATPEQNSLFFERMRLLQQRNFMPLNFVDSVVSAKNVNASLAEVELAHNAIAKAMRKGSEMKVDKNLTSKFVPYFDVANQFKQKGLDIITLNQRQKENAITNVKVWDVINGITDFASHDYGFGVSDSSLKDLQVLAGSMFDKPFYDTQNLVGISLAN